MSELVEVIREHGGVDYDGRRTMWICTCGADLSLDGPRVPHSDHLAAAVLAWIDETLDGVQLDGSECGDHEEPEGWRAEFERRTGWSPPTHYPTGYAAGCDGCAAAQSADNEATATLSAIKAALRGDS